MKTTAATKYAVANMTTRRVLGYDLMPGAIFCTTPKTWRTEAGAQKHADRLTPAPMGAWEVFTVTTRGNIV